MPPPLRAAVLLLATAWLWSAACAADGDDITTFLPPVTASPFPFCPVRPSGASTGVFPWLTPPPPPPPSTAMFPQDPGFLPSGTCPVSSAVAWLPLLAVFSVFFVPWMYQ